MAARSPGVMHRIAWSSASANRVKLSSILLFFAIAGSICFRGQEGPALSLSFRSSGQIPSVQNSGAQFGFDGEAFLARSAEGENVLGLIGGLGYAPNYGLTNQCIALLGLVVYAREKQIRFISQETLKFFAGWTSTTNDVAFGELFNVTHWNIAALKFAHLPLPLIVKAANVTHWIHPQNVSQNGFIIFEKSSEPLTCHFWRSLQPAHGIEHAIQSLQLGGRLGALHARIENDLRAPGIPPGFWQGRSPLPLIYSWIVNSTNTCVQRPDALYMCVMNEDVSEPEDRNVLDHGISPWQGVPLVLGGSAAIRRAGLQGDRIHGAVIDFIVSRSALYFIGNEGLSTFTRAIMTSRTCASIPCNLHYSPEGVRIASF